MIGDKTKEVGKVMWRRTTSWFTKVSFGYSTHEKSTKGGKVGWES